MVIANRARRPLQYCAALCVAMLCCAAALSAQSTEWKPFTYPADGFQASFPSMPEVQRKAVTTEAGSFEMHSYLVQVASVALFVGACDYGSSIAAKDPDEMLQGVKNGALLNSGSHLISEKKIALTNHSGPASPGPDYPGLEYEAENETAHVKARIYVVGTTLYQTLVLTPLGKPYSDTARFLDSFQLVAKTSN